MRSEIRNIYIFLIKSTKFHVFFLPSLLSTHGFFTWITIEQWNMNHSSKGKKFTLIIFIKN